MRKESTSKRRAGTQFRNHWLLPSINLEDLSKPRNLLLFVRSRTRNPPGEFVNVDANSVHIAHTSQALMPAHTSQALMPPNLSEHTIFLSGQNIQASYGRIVSWDEDGEAFDMMSNGTGLQPGEGLQVMEIQQRKMQFLHKFVELVLQDHPLSNLSISKQPEPSLDRLQGNSSNWPSLT